VTKLDAYWPEILDVVRQKVPQQTFNTWFLPLYPENSENGDYRVGCPNHFFMDWFSEHHLSALNEAGSVYFGENILFSLKVEEKSEKSDFLDKLEESATSVSSPESIPETKPVRPLNPGFATVATPTARVLPTPSPVTANNLNPDYNFQNFVVGSGTDLAFAAATRSMDVLLVDDVAFLAGKESTQEEFFHTFNALYDQKKQIVLTSDRSPKEIATLEERLRSRFEWGLITDIQAPNLETRIAILKRKIEVNHIYITDEVVSYIAENITDNIRRLEGALIRLLAFASLTGREISLEMASEVLSSFFQGSSTGPVKIANVMEVVAETMDVTVDQLKSKRRTQDLARARQIAMNLAREMTGASLNQIGRSFGNRDHSTVSYACQKIQTDMDNDPRFRGVVRNMMDKIRNKQ